MRRFQSLLEGRTWAAIIGGSLAGVLIFAVVMIWRGGRGETIVLQVMPVDDPNIVRVYVGGEVVNPGLYSLPRGSRVANAIQAAGGATASGDIGGFGMASVVEDADQIIIPARHAASSPVPVLPVSGGSGAAPVASSTQVRTSVNINRASATELEVLPGIGPALAERIIEHREANGPFRTIDELEAVRGISARMVDEMRAMITVGP